MQLFTVIHLQLFLVAFVRLSHQLGCLSANYEPICCRGKRNDCYSYTESKPVTSWNYAPYQKYLANLHLAKKKCFCDETCLVSGDCCPNYRLICSSYKVNCTVSNWGKWSQCNQSCGKGVSTRYRRVVKLNKNGGLPCPVLKESKPCVGQNCVSRRVGRSGALMLPYAYAAKNEVAHLLPVRGDVLDMTRRFDMRWDVRRKLYLGRLIKMNKSEEAEPDPYCAVYEITQANHACQTNNLLWQKTSAHHYPHRTKQWRARLRGRTRRRRHISQFNRYPHYNSLKYNSFNGAHVMNKNLNNHYTYNHQTGLMQNKLDHQPWLTHASLLMKGQQICVTCYPAYMRKDSGYRCTGSGLANTELRWRALRTLDCQGKFRMINMPQRSCTCGRGIASFVFV